MAEAPRLALSPVSAVRLLRRDPLELLERAARAGDVVRIRVPRLDLFVINRPDLVWDVLAGHGDRFTKGPTMQAAKRMLGESLLTSEGAHHRRQRRLIQPLFHHDRIDALVPAIRAAGERATLRWNDGETIDVRAEMARLTLEIVVATLFGAGLHDEDAARVGAALNDVMAQFDRVFSPFLPVTERLPIPATRRFQRARGVFDETIYRMIAERRARGIDGDDLLSLLMRAQDAGVPMTDEQVRDEAVTIFLAGHETTANALTWTWLLLSEHPDAHERLDDPASVEAVLHESMRLYPPAWAIGRRVVQDHHADGVTIPAGSVVIVSPWLLHHDVRWWPDPAAFDPDRWLGRDRTTDQPTDRPTDRPANRPANRPAERHAYLPFGAGSRMCIGEGFAQLEATTLLTTIGRMWRFERDPADPVELQPVVTLRPKGGLWMRVWGGVHPGAGTQRG
jgi:cytochrome P450